MHRTKFNKILDSKNEPIKIYDRLYPFSEVLEVRNPVLYFEMLYKYVSTLAQDPSDSDEDLVCPPNTARPNFK